MMDTTRWAGGAESQGNLLSGNIQDLWKYDCRFLYQFGQSSLNQWNFHLLDKTWWSMEEGKGEHWYWIKAIKKQKGFMKIYARKDKNSSFYPSNHTSSKCKWLHLRDQAGCNQTGEQEICSPATSASISPSNYSFNRLPSFCHKSSTSSSESMNRKSSTCFNSLQRNCCCKKQ